LKEVGGNKKLAAQILEIDRVRWSPKTGQCAKEP